MPLLNRQRVLAAKVEGTKGTAESLSATDGKVYAEDIRFNYTPDETPRNPLRSSISTITSIAGPKIATVTCRCEMKGSGTSTTAPSWGTLLRGCGFSETVGSSNVVYTPDSDDGDTDTLTIAVYNGSSTSTRIRKMYGARGNVSFDFNANQIVYMDFTFTGIFDDETAGTQLSPTYESTVPVKWYNSSVAWAGSMSLSGTDCVVSTMSLDMANNVVLRQDANASNGLSYAIITARDPGGTIDPDSVLQSTEDWMSHIETPTTGTFAFNVGSASGNTLAFSAPVFQTIGTTDTDSDGVSKDDIAFKLRGSSGDDELTITHS